MQNALTPFTTEITSRTTYLERFRNLAANLPHAIYQGVPKIKIPLESFLAQALRSAGEIQPNQNDGQPMVQLLFSDKDTLTARNHVKAAMEEVGRGGEGITFDGLMADPVVNIPVSTIAKLDEAGAKTLFQALMPTLNLGIQMYRNRVFLQETLGIAHGDEIVRNQFHDNDPFHYEFFLPCKRTWRDVLKPTAAQMLNKALGEKLFHSAIMEGGDFERIWVDELDVDRLRNNPNTAAGKLADVLAGCLDGLRQDGARNRIGILRQRCLPGRDR